MHESESWLLLLLSRFSRVRLCAAKSLQLCTTLCDPIDGNPPGSPVHGILQARTLEWVAMPSSRGSSQPAHVGVAAATASSEVSLYEPRIRGMDLILGQEDPLEKGMATHSGILAWRIPWTEEPGRLFLS